MNCESWRRCELEALAVLMAYGASTETVATWFRDIYRTERSHSAISEQWRRIRRRANGGLHEVRGHVQ